MKRSGHIRNPLSIIAIFAGIAEISGTIVLPLLKENVQTTYVWFLMLFPSGLVLLFFGTLWKKAPVLYAPSDYSNEDNFLKSMQPATAAEISRKQKQELADAELVAAARVSEEEPIHANYLQNIDTTFNQYQTNDLKRKYIRAEKLAVEKLSQRYENLRRNVTVKSFSGESLIIDAMLHNDKGGITIFEIKYIPLLNAHIIRMFTKRFIETLKERGIKLNDKFKLVMVFVIQNKIADGSKSKITLRAMDLLDEKYSKYIEIEYMGLDELNENSIE